MIPVIYTKRRFLLFLMGLLFSVILVLYSSNSNSQESNLLGDTTNASSSKITYGNPRVYNVDYSFELVPDPAKIVRAKDLKLWVPIPREWDSQKAVKIVSVNPPPHAEYEDPEHGHRMLFWDFGKGPEKPSYKVDIKYRLESYEVHAEVDPEHIEPYDKTSKEYALYTRSTHTISVTPKIKELAQIAVGDEKNPYLQAERIFKFVRKKMRYKFVRYERGSGISSLMDFPVINQETGEEYYEGACGQYSDFFVALCRAMGIPARSNGGWIGWRPWIKEEDLKQFRAHYENLSPDGLAPEQIYAPLGDHAWSEFYLPNYGWIPVDATTGRFGHLSNKKVILDKGRDVKIGPHAPQKRSEGYGVNWVLLNNGRADILFTGIWNIAKIRMAKVKLIHHSDPFPADGLSSYGENTFQKEDVEKNLRHWRKGVLSWPSNYERSSIPDSLNLVQFYNDYPQTREAREAFVCHMLRRQLGDENFIKLVDTYIKLRQKSNQSVSTTCFKKLAEDLYGESLDWFFDQWMNSTELPRLKLENVNTTKDKKGWHVHGRLVQLSKTTFQLPIELALETTNGRKIKKLFIDSKAVGFNFHTQNKPQKIIVDPEYETLKIQRMPPRLVWFWDVYPKYILIYGTLAKAKENKAAAKRFNEDYLMNLNEIIKADTDVIQDDLKNKCVILFGRPETNKISKQFKDIFPIKFDKNKFTWQGTTYDLSSQGVAQIVENPLDPENKIIQYTGLSNDTKQKFWELYTMNTDASYVIFDSDKKLVSSDWEEYDKNLVWHIESE